ncbi:hypothetical protein [Streptomyces sp. NPDC003247]|uniref:hypothetical protein n=1 Tax=Streptomyces sp. NPDC003247 TaxID=3364677 RepID=UPI0036AFD99D
MILYILYVSQERSAEVTAAPPGRAPGETVVLPVRDALEALPVQAEDRTGCTRDQFRHWIDADGDGCSTRIICTLRPGVPDQA